MSEEIESKRRGLASAPPETRSRVAKTGGLASHNKRGLQAADHETRVKVAKSGGIARGAQRRRVMEERIRAVSPNAFH
jgi:hypothetical protein